MRGFGFLLVFSVGLVMAQGDVEARLARGDEQVMGGDYAAALKTMDGLERLVTPTESNAGRLFNLACVYAVQGRIDQAMDTLALCLPFLPVSTAHLQKDSDLDALRGEARFKALLGEWGELSVFRTTWINDPLQPPSWLPSGPEPLSEADRLFGLATLWSEVKYNFAWFDQVPDLDWDGLYRSMIPKVIATVDTQAYYQLLTEMIAKLRDGHSNVYPPRYLREKRGRPPLRTALVEERVLVVGLQNDGLKELGLAVGQEIMEVDGMPVLQHAAKQLPYISAGTPQDLEQRQYGAYLLQGDVEKPVRLRLFRKDGSRFEVSVSRKLPRYRSDSVTFRVTDHNMGLLTINSFSDRGVAETCRQLLPQIMATDGLMIDVRRNGGGNTPMWLMDMLCSSYTISEWQTRAHAPTMRAWERVHPHVGGGGGQRNSSVAERYEKPVAVLIGAYTFSAAEDFVAMFQMAERGKIFGQASGGSTGQPLFFRLPGGGSARVCAKRDTLPTGADFVGKGLKPDVVIQPTVASIRAGQDLVLTAAVDWLKQGGK